MLKAKTSSSLAEVYLNWAILAVLFIRQMTIGSTNIDDSHFPGLRTFPKRVLFYTLSYYRDAAGFSNPGGLAV